MGITDWNELAIYLRVDVKLSSSTIYVQKSRHKILFLYFLDKPFTRDTFNQFINSLHEKSYKEGYINCFIKLAKHIDKHMAVNQLQDYSYYKEKKNIYIQLLTPDEVEQLAQIILPYSYEKNYLMKTLIYFLGRSGCRINEALTLTWDDVFDTFVLFRDTKNGDDRKVPIFPSMLELLNGLPRINGKLFTMSSQEVNRDLKRRASKCGIKKKVYCHLFRHSYIDQMNKQKVPLAYIQAVVGHKSLESTSRYLHPQMDEILYFMGSHPLERVQQKYSTVAELLDDFIVQRIDTKRFKVVYKVEEL